MLGGLDSPTSGTIKVNGKAISTLTNSELADYRASTVGFVFQFYNLIPTLTVKENVALVKEIAPNALSAEQMLSEVGLSDHLNNFPRYLQKRTRGIRGRDGGSRGRKNDGFHFVRAVPCHCYSYDGYDHAQNCR